MKKGVNMKSTILLVFLFSASIASARIGETFSQCKSRYGEPLVHNEEVTIFQKNGLQIAVFFYQGKACALFFEKVEKDVLGRCVEISDDEKIILLNANGSGWKGGFGKWTSEGGLLSAQYTHLDNKLAIITKDAVNRSASESERKAAEKLKDF